MKDKYLIQKEILKNKSFYTQQDYEMANELLNLNDDSKFQKEVQSIIDNMDEMIENNDSDRMPL